jgi:glycosyltransferase involved in cell wall biosynthesis
MANKGNILLVANWESNVGYAWWLMENFWVTISEYFGREGRTSYLIYPEITRIPESIAESDIVVLEHNFHKHTIRNFRRLRWIIKQHNIRYLYLTDAPSYSQYYLLLRMVGIRKIVVHDHTPGERTRASGWRKLLKSTIHKVPLFSADHFVAVTDFVYRRLLEVDCIPEEKCSCAPNGIVPIDLKDSDPEYTLKQFNIPKEQVIVVTTGRATYYKGIDFFIECANELINIQQMRQLHFLYCGDGPDINEFKSLVRQYELGNHFTFAGNRSDIPEILASCQIGFHAATGEVGYSLSILEYMSAGLTAIVPDRPSTSLATVNMQNGILYRPRDIQSATDAIRTALDPGKSKQIRENAVRHIHERFNINDTNRRLTEILQAVYT